MYEQKYFYVYLNTLIETNCVYAYVCIFGSLAEAYLAKRNG